ncbi:MAG: hypothetical protein ACYTEX_02760, partial [Planctomycetota bacterium]
GGCGTQTNVGGTGIDVTLETGNFGACSCRNLTATGTLADVERDFVFADNESSSPDADFILTLGNLVPGSSYQLFSYHSRTDEADTTIPSVTVTGATNVTKPDTILQSGGNHVYGRHERCSDPLRGPERRLSGLPGLLQRL